MSYESLMEELDEIVSSWRKIASDKEYSDENKATVREKLIAQIRNLGFSLGDAERWLALPGDHR